MQRMTKGVLFLLLFLGFAATAAAQSLTIDGVSPSSVEVVQGETFTADVSYTTDSGGGSISSCTLGVLASSLPSNWDADSDTSVQTTGGSTRTVAMPQVTAGSTTETDITVQVQCDSSSGTLSDQSSLHVTATAPPALSGTLKSAGSIDVSAGESYTVSFSVSNTGGTDTQNAKAVISTPAGYSATDAITLTEAGQPDGVIRDGRSTGTQSFTVTADDPTDGTITIDLTSASIGVTDSLSVSVDAPETGGDDDGGGGGGGGETGGTGGGGLPQQPDTPTVSIDASAVSVSGITADTAGATVNLTRADQPPRVTRITVMPAGVSQVDNLSLTIEGIGGVAKEQHPTAAVRVDRFLRMSASTTGVAANVTFTVNRSWLDRNSVDPDDVGLYRYQDGWSKLETQLVGQEGDRYRYRAHTPGFSLFMVAAEQPTPPPDPEEPGDDQNATNQSIEEPAQQGGIPFLPVGIGVIVLVVFGAGAIYWMRRRQDIGDQLKAVTTQVAATVDQYDQRTQEELLNEIERTRAAYEQGRDRDVVEGLQRINRLLDQGQGTRRDRWNRP